MAADPSPPSTSTSTSTDAGEMNGSERDIQAVTDLDAETFTNILYPLVECRVCAKLLVDPVTLPCGGTLCRACLPGSIALVDSIESSLAIENIPSVRPRCPYFWTSSGQYASSMDGPAREKRIPPAMRERFDCPFECRRRHHSRDVSSNFILAKILDSMTSLQSLPVRSEIPPIDPPSHAILVKIHSELDCQICYLLLHDPITTPCGHTFCRPCLLRTSDHATHPVCPTCRSPVLLPTPQNTPTNILIDTLIHTLFPLAATDRAQCETSERHASSSGIDTPIFVCTLALPSVTCFLHIFEPRYRLMLRRCMAGDRRFGMVLPRSRVGTRHLDETISMQYHPPIDSDHRYSVGGSRATFMQYGTMLEIRELQLLPDGRSLVETIGRERFSISDWSVRDGYIVARTHPLPDLEPHLYNPPSLDVVPGLTTSILTNTLPETLGTNELIYLTRSFVQSLRRVAWLSARMRDNEVDEQLRRLDSRGDAVRFAWWVGSKMPMEEEEAYSLLLQGGVRELYCLIGRWIGDMERQSWYCPPSALLQFDFVGVDCICGLY